MKGGTVVLIVVGVAAAGVAGYMLFVKPSVRQPANRMQAPGGDKPSFFSSLGRTLGDFGQAANLAGSIQDDFSNLFS